MGRLIKVITALALVITSAVPANAKLIFTNDVFVNDAPTFRIGADKNASTDTLTLEFGGTNTKTLTWDTTKFSISNDTAISGGISATGQVNFSGAAGTRLREANPTTASCATVNELIVSTADGKIYRCSVIGTPGTWVSTIAAISDFEGVYGADGDKTITTTNGAFTIAAGTGAVNVNSTTGGISLNNNVNGAVNIGTGSSTGAVSIGGGSNTVGIDSSVWDITTAGVVSGLTGLTSSGTVSFTGGMGASGGAVNLNNNSNNDVNIGTGTSTGTVTLGGTGAQTIAVGNGAGAKTVNVGSSITTSTTTLLSGSGGLNANVSNNQPTNINTGTSTGAVAIGGGSNTVSINSSVWDITTAGVASGLTGVTSTGTANFSGTGSFRIREVASIAAAACTTVNELALDTTANQIYKCTVTGTPGTWTSTGGGTNSFETVYSNDADKILTTTNGAFTIAAGTGAVNVNSTTGGISLNNNVNGGINIGTGTSTGAVAIGGGSNTVGIDSSVWDITTAGVASGFTGLTSTGNINLTGATSFHPPQAASAPGTCSVGQIYYNTTTNNFWDCETTNVWSVLPSISSLGSSGQILRSNATSSPSWSTATYPATAGTAGNILRSDGTNFVSTPVTTAQSTPADPSTTSSTTGVMMGLAGSITPARSGTILIVISGDIENSTEYYGAQVQIRTGTGAAPANGAALTGTARGGLVKIINDSSPTQARHAFSTNAIVTGLTAGTAVWIDVGLAAISGGTARIRNISISAVEL